MKRVLTSAIVIAGLIVLAASAVRSDEKADEAADNALSDKLPPATTASVRRLLSERIEIPDRYRSELISIKTVAKFLTREALKRNEALPVTIDMEAFKDASPDAGDIWDVPVQFPKHLRSMTYRQVFELSSSQVPASGTFIIRDGVIVIFPGEFKVQQLLRSKIAAEIRGKTLLAALEEISDRSGLNIFVDSRCDDRKTVNLQFDGGAKVGDILESLADTNDLKLVITPSRVTVMPQAAYLKRLADQLQEAKLRRELELNSRVDQFPQFDAGNRAK